MSDFDREELAKLLGPYAKLLQTPKLSGPLGVDPHKPVSDGTGTQVVQTLTGQGGPPRPEPGKPAVKPPEHQALILPYNPVRPQEKSAEIKLFLETRKPPRPGTIQVLLVLRGTSS
jgi:hypothetical protein